MGLFSKIFRRSKHSGTQSDNLSLFGVPVEVRDWVDKDKFWIIPKVEFYEEVNMGADKDGHLVPMQGRHYRETYVNGKLVSVSDLAGKNSGKHTEGDQSAQDGLRKVNEGEV